MTEHKGQAFRRARVDANLSLREVAAKLGISAVRLGEYERGVSKPLDWRPLYSALAPRTPRYRTGPASSYWPVYHGSRVIALCPTADDAQRVRAALEAGNDE